MSAPAEFPTLAEAWAEIDRLRAEVEQLQQNHARLWRMTAGDPEPSNYTARPTPTERPGEQVHHISRGGL